MKSPTIINCTILAFKSNETTILYADGLSAWDFKLLQLIDIFHHLVKVSGRSWESFLSATGIFIMLLPSACWKHPLHNTSFPSPGPCITPARSHVLICDSTVTAFDITSQSEFKSHWFFSFCPSSLWFSCQCLSCTVVGLKMLSLPPPKTNSHTCTHINTHTHAPINNALPDTICCRNTRFCHMHWGIALCISCLVIAICDRWMNTLRAQDAIYISSQANKNE